MSRLVKGYSVYAECLINSWKFAISILIMKIYSKSLAKLYIYFRKTKRYLNDNEHAN